jgi:SAM-dependent methyltransferase
LKEFKLISSIKREVMINLDYKTVEGFGKEWEFFDQSSISKEELTKQFNCYFRIFPWSSLKEDAIGLDMGCGSGRWAMFVAPRVGKLFCIDASEKALAVARNNLKQYDNCKFYKASFEDIPIEDNSLDFGYSLGVLHHIPNTEDGIKSCVMKLKSGAPFLLYIYYALENKPKWFQMIWRVTDAVRHFIATLPFKLRFFITQAIALVVYFPLARLSLILEKLNVDVDSFPLSIYRNQTFYSMRTDALDRFGTRLEKRFKASEIKQMMENAGLERVQFSDSPPFWCAIGYKR